MAAGFYGITFEDNGLPSCEFEEDEAPAEKDGSLVEKRIEVTLKNVKKVI